MLFSLHGVPKQRVYYSLEVQSLHHFKIDSRFCVEPLPCNICCFILWTRLSEWMCGSYVTSWAAVYIPMHTDSNNSYRNCWTMSRHFWAYCCHGPLDTTSNLVTCLSVKTQKNLSLGTSTINLTLSRPWIEMQFCIVGGLLVTVLSLSFLLINWVVFISDGINFFI